MAVSFNQEKLYDGVDFLTISDSRFKTNYISVKFVTDISAKTASQNAVSASVISKSSADYPDISQLSKALSALYGASINKSVSKIGDSQVVSVSASCIADKYTFDGEKITEKLCDILIGCILRPDLEGEAFEPKKFALDKQELLDDIDAEINEKRSYALQRAGKKIFVGEPAEISSYGDREEAEKLTPESAYKQYRNLLETAEINIIFAGSGNPVCVKEKFAEAFGNLKRDFGKKSTTKRSALKSEVCNETEKLDIVQSKMVIAFKTDCDNPEALKMLNSIYGATPFSKLFENVREKMSLCYYCASRVDKHKGVLLVDSGVEHTNIEKAREAVIAQLRDIADGNFTDEDMQNSLLSIINGVKGFNDSGYAMAMWYFAQKYDGESYSPEEEIERISAVTREDIIAAAKSMKLDTVYVLTGKGEQ